MNDVPILMTFPAGSDFDKTLQLTVDGVSPITSYSNTDVLSARLWAGANQPVLATAPTISWVDASTAQFLVSFLANVTTGFDIGIYRCQVLCTRSGRTTVIADFGVELTEVPGTAAALKTYCATSDLLYYAPWVAKLQSSQDIQGFMRERNEACLWFEDIIHRHWRGGQGLAPDYYFLPGIAFGGTSFGRYATVYRSGVRSLTLQQWLDSGGTGNTSGLMITQPVLEANACYAISRICAKQVKPDKESQYHDFYLSFAARAEAVASSITVEIDTDNDGQTDTYVRLGIADTLEG